MIPRHAFHSVDELVRALDTVGCVFIPDALPGSLCDAARARIDALVPRDWDEVHTDPLHGGRHLDRYLCVFNRDPFWLQFLDRPGIVEAMQAMLGADCHIIGMTAWRTHPGYRDEGFHADYAPPSNAAFIITVHYYLSAVDADCAPTRVMPGEAAEVVIANAGDAFIFRSNLLHAGSANRSDRMRHLLQVHYGRREMAQHFVPFMDWRFDPEVLARATQRQRRLLGDHDPGAYD